MKPLLKTLIVAVALATIAAACSAGNATEAAPAATTTSTEPVTTSEVPTTAETTSTTSTSSTSTTTTTTLAAEVAPTINGLPGEDGTEDRRIVAVKIDNHPAARPQSGIEAADAVYEVLVEGGLTRFIGMFQQSDSDYVGPNRSGRPTDSTLMAPLGAAFQISGAQSWVQDIFKRDGVHVSYDTGATTWRMHHRVAPHNLYTSTLKIRDYADARGWPDEAPSPLFVYGNEPTEASSSADTITLDWSDHPSVVWKWDGEQYLRFNGTTPHEWVDDRASVDEAGQIATDTIVVIEGRKYTASDPAGKGSSVPAIHTVGTGDALVFYDGGMFEATWTRDSIDELIRIVDDEGNDVILPAGRIWINVFPDNRTVAWE